MFACSEKPIRPLLQGLFGNSNLSFFGGPFTAQPWHKPTQGLVSHVQQTANLCGACRLSAHTLPSHQKCLVCRSHCIIRRPVKPWMRTPCWSFVTGAIAICWPSTASSSSRQTPKVRVVCSVRISERCCRVCLLDTILLHSPSTSRLYFWGSVRIVRLSINKICMMLSTPPNGVSHFLTYMYALSIGCGSRQLFKPLLQFVLAETWCMQTRTPRPC